MSDALFVTLLGASLLVYAFYQPVRRLCLILRAMHRYRLGLSRASEIVEAEPSGSLPARMSAVRDVAMSNEGYRKDDWAMRGMLDYCCTYEREDAIPVSREGETLSDFQLSQYSSDPTMECITRLANACIAEVEASHTRPWRVPSARLEVERFIAGTQSFVYEKLNRVELAVYAEAEIDRVVAAWRGRLAIPARVASPISIPNEETPQTAPASAIEPIRVLARVPRRKRRGPDQCKEN